MESDPFDLANMTKEMLFNKITSLRAKLDAAYNAGSGGVDNLLQYLEVYENEYEIKLQDLQEEKSGVILDTEILGKPDATAKAEKPIKKKRTSLLSKLKSDKPTNDIGL